MEAFMPNDDFNLLEALKFELQFLEDGGYGRSPQTPWKPTLFFEDSPTCLNFNRWEKPAPCSECLLMQFVPQEHRSGKIPCRHIKLNTAGQTLQSLYECATQLEAEEALESWLRTTINRLEQQRPGAANPGTAAKSVAR
jgi:hypothetical protein